MLKKYLIVLLALGLFQSSASHASFQDEEKQKAFQKIKFGGAVAAGGAFLAVSSYFWKINSLDPRDHECLYPSHRGEQSGDIRAIGSGKDILIRQDHYCYELLKNIRNGIYPNLSNHYDVTMIGGVLIFIYGMTNIAEGFMELCYPTGTKFKKH